MARPMQEIQAAYECVPNIGPRGRRRRFVMAAVCTAVALAFALYLQLGGFLPAWRGLLAAPFLAAALYYFQAREKT